jgi:hypothetical protein
MLSIPWKETLKHQTNFSPCKSTFAFSKDKRFKNKEGTLYLWYYLDVTHFTIYLLLWAKLPLQVWEEATRLPLLMLQLLLPLLSIITSSPLSKLRRGESNSHLADRT